MNRSASIDSGNGVAVRRRSAPLTGGFGRSRVRRAPAILACAAETLPPFASNAAAAVTANVVANELRVTGDGADNTIRLRLPAAIHASRET